MLIKIFFILIESIKALNCIWHINHFRCFQCNADLGGSYVDVDGSPFCKQCYLLKNAPKCKGCSNPITGAYINAIGAYWHADCFACRVSGFIVQNSIPQMKSLNYMCKA